MLHRLKLCLEVIVLLTVKFQFIEGGIHGGNKNQGRELLQSQPLQFDFVDPVCKEEVLGKPPQSLEETREDCNNVDPYNPGDIANCGQFEIFNPVPAPEGRYPYYVSLQQPLQQGVRYRHYCGGALLTRDVFVTAAHCIWTAGDVDFRDVGDGKGNGVLGKNRIYVALGPYCRHQKGLQRIPATGFFMHPNYNGYPYLSEDLVLVKLESPFDYTGPFPDFQSAKNFVYENTSYFATAIGHGAQTLEEANPQNGEDPLGDQVFPLGTATFKYLPTDACDVLVKTASTQLKIFPQKMVCFENMANKQDTCFGDSGSPVLYMDDNSVFGDPQQDIVIGLTSWGPDLTCNGAGLPGVYTRIGNFVDWIIDTLERESAFFQRAPTVTTPSPTPEPTPQPTPTPEPEPIPQPTPTPEPVPIPQPTPTPELTPQPTPAPDPVASSDAAPIPKICLLETKAGPGEGALTRWYYDNDSKKCSTFLFGGFGGNQNNFRTKSQCEDACIITS